jgi:aminoglycoside phosphotransferase (APT) family kinase protein
MHSDELPVPLPTVRALVEAQFPEWRDLPIRRVASTGTTNAVFRVGDELAARFPLQPGDVETVRLGLRAEADAAAELVGRSRFPTPAPVALGEPGSGYPLPWAVQTWVPGVPADADGVEDVSKSTDFAHDLADFVRDVRAIDTRGRVFGGRGRGGDLRTHDEWMATCFEHSERLLDVPKLRGMWAAMRELPRGDADDVMNHGDLIPGNVLVSGGRLAGVLDAGGLGPADPALDLVAAWHLLDDEPRLALREDLGCGDLEWRRGQAWAFQQAMGLVWYYETGNPVMSRLGRRTLDRLAAAAVL